MRTSLLVAKNTLIQSIGRVASLAFSIVIIALITRYLGTGQFGHFTTINAYLFFFAVFSEFGLYILTSRELPVVANVNEFLSDIFSLKLIGSLLLFTIGAVAIFAFPYPIDVKYGVLIASIGFVANSFVSLFSAYFQYKLATTSIAISDVMNKIVILVLIFGAMKLELGLYGVLGAFTVGMIAQALILFIRFSRDIRLSLRIRLASWKRIFQQSWPLAASGILILFYFRTDTIILSLYHSASTVGIYGAAYRFLEVLISFPGLFMGLLLPLLSKSFESRDKERFARIWQRSFDALALVVWPMIFFTLGAAPEILRYLAGEEYVSGANTLRLLIIATGLIFFGHLTSYTVSALNLQKKMIKHYAIGACGALALYFLLIPSFGGIGAAIGTIAVESYVVSTTLYIVKGFHPFPFSLRTALVSLVCAIGGSIGFFLAKPISIFVATPVFFAVYAILGFFTNAFDKTLIKEFTIKILRRNQNV